MLGRHRTKLLSLLFVAAFCVTVPVLYSGPASDRRFALGCTLVFGAIVTTLILVARVLRCPQCGADMGRFEGLGGPSAPLRRSFPRYLKCRRCGCVVDRHDGNRPVA